MFISLTLSLRIPLYLNIFRVPYKYKHWLNERAKNYLIHIFFLSFKQLCDEKCKKQGKHPDHHIHVVCQSVITTLSVHICEICYKQNIIASKYDRPRFYHQKKNFEKKTHPVNMQISVTSFHFFMAFSLLAYTKKMEKECGRGGRITCHRAVDSATRDKRNMQKKSDFRSGKNASHIVPACHLFLFRYFPDTEWQRHHSDAQRMGAEVQWAI